MTSAFYVDDLGSIDTWLLVTPASGLIANSVYTLSLPAGAVTDSRGNASAAFAISFSTEYTVRTAAVAATVTLIGSTLTVTPSASLSTATSYTLTVPAGAVVSATGVPLAAFTLGFRTYDPNLPRVTSTDPANGATGVSTAVQVNVFFNKATVSGPAFGAIALKDAGGAAVPAIVEYYCDTEGCIESMLLITPAAPLTSQRGYTVTLPAGAVRDRSGNDSAAYDFGFTTQ